MSSLTKVYLEKHILLEFSCIVLNSMLLGLSQPIADKKAWPFAFLALLYKRRGKHSFY
ncbi:hypothetical protein EI42_05903 [Thermosporothrix hazakensis]|jgi:hypothetical protein|uniref:Uncharacterized protein n=1 Tax=Thermosporothrix hazakensis TaxID=644383 RepID=A0A326TWF5_THEHA|nr:hypothetical protein EI42_05903 [Thermosporothrix hazakensis]